MSKKILVTIFLGLALSFAAVLCAEPHAVQSQPDLKALQDTTTYPGPGESDPLQDETVSTQAYPEPESTSSTQSQTNSVPMVAVILVAVFVVVFVVAIWLVNRLRRQG